MKFSLSEMTRPPNAVSTDTGFMSINIQSGMKLSFGCYEFFIPGFILGPLSSSSPSLSLSLLEAQNQSSEPNSLARTTSMKSKFVLQFSSLCIFFNGLHLLESISSCALEGERSFHCE